MIDFAVNGTSIPGVDSRWRRIERNDTPDGLIAYTDWAINTWVVPLAIMSAFDALQLVAGQALSLTTNDITNRDAETTYATAYLKAAINPLHQGINMRNMTLEFAVKVS